MFHRHVIRHLLILILQGFFGIPGPINYSGGSSGGSCKVQRTQAPKQLGKGATAAVPGHTLPSQRR